MTSPRSFEQIARRAMNRLPGLSWARREAVITKARLKDARARLGAHTEQGRRYDRRIAIGRRARAAVAIVAANMVGVA